jgi:hypothetical protein
MAVQLRVLIALGALVVAACAEDFYPKASGVINLNPQNFDKVVKQSNMVRSRCDMRPRERARSAGLLTWRAQVTLVEFYAPCAYWPLPAHFFFARQVHAVHALTARHRVWPLQEPQARVDQGREDAQGRGAGHRAGRERR